MAFGGFMIVRRWRESRKPQERAKYRVKEAATDIEEWWDSIRKSFEKARERGVNVELMGQDERGKSVRLTGVRLTDRKGKPLGEEGGERSDVLKKLLWA